MNSPSYKVWVALVLVLMQFSPVCHASGSWSLKYAETQNESLCQKLLQRLKKDDPHPITDKHCSREIVASYLVFSAPHWEELDSSKYENLVFQLEKYAQEGADGYFHRIQGLQPRQPDSVYRSRAKDFIKSGGHLRIWRTKDDKFLRFRGSFPVVASNDTEQAIIQMVESNGACGINQDINLRGSLFLVMPDLSGPDPGADAGLAYLLSASTLMILGEHPILISDEEVWINNSGAISLACQFKHR